MAHFKDSDAYKKREEEKIVKYNNKMVNKMVNHKKNIQKAIALIEMGIDISENHKIGDEEVKVAKELLNLYDKKQISDFELDEVKTINSFNELKKRKNIK